MGSEIPKIIIFFFINTFSLIYLVFQSFSGGGEIE